jgi:PiT family inorganic phosphate transporter
MTPLIIAVVVLLAWSNGSNDNFKGVATIYGSGTASYRAALLWATATQVAGSLCAVLLAAGLIKAFSAKGLVPDAVAASPAFLGAAALGAAVTVLLATWLGLPVSTTHALTGALVGAGLSSGAGVHFAVLGKGFVLPLLLSPVLAIGIAAALYPLARRGRIALGVERQSCICVGEEWVAISSPAGAAVVAARMTVTAARQGCADRYQGRVVGISAQRTLDALHFASAGAVCFARALNDTPKIAGILLGAHALGATVGLPVIGGAMAVGGILGARRVGETMSHKIASLNAGQGFVANLTTAVLVICASKLALPVSTTHVATGGIFGIAAVTGKSNRKTILSILTAWATTLPLGALIGAAVYLVLR